MDTQEILFKLEQVKEKEKDKQYFTGELNVYAMVIDVIDFIKEQERTIHSLDCELADIYYPQPYKFEDLKPNMWVWDKEIGACMYIKEIKGKEIVLLGGESFIAEIININDKFEENRFFPPTKAMKYQGKEDEDEDD